MDTILTHPEKILYPEDKLTKADIFSYYQSIASHILPHIVNRPLTLVRCPNSYQECFYQRHSLGNMAHVYVKKIKEKNNSFKECLYIKDKTGLFSLIQMDVLEIHPWGCHIDDIDHPDRLIFDLDPGPDVAWSEVVLAAKRIRQYFKTLRVFVKTTGGKGLHVVIPIQAQYEWPVVKAFAKKVAEDLAQRYPENYVTTISKTKRQGKIFLDYLRNQMSASAVALYSTRARIHAPIAIPLSWRDLETISMPQITVVDLIHKKQKLKFNAWRGFFNVNQSILNPKKNSVTSLIK